MDNSVLEVKKLRKFYGKVKAVEDISFDVKRGEVFGLLGPNGAGKTTTINCVCGLRRYDGGTIIVNGVDAVQQKQRAQSMLGVVPQDLALYEDLSVETNLEVFGSLYPSMNRKKIRESAERCLSFVALEKHRKREVKELSGGMKRRLNIAVALMHDPPLVLADEPTVGVDPQSRNHIFDRVEDMAREGKGVVYTTHYMEEVERLCHRAAIVDHGRIVASGTLDELLSLAENKETIRFVLRGFQPCSDSDDARKGYGTIDDMGFRCEDLPSSSPKNATISPSKLTEAIRERFLPLHCELRRSVLELCFNGIPPVSELVKWLNEKNVEIIGIEMKRPTLEDAFLKLTGRSLRDG